jgi:hypothetical protein
MRHNQIVAILQQHGFSEGRVIAPGKSEYCKRHRGHFVMFNATICNVRRRLIMRTGLDLTKDAPRLTEAARAVGENLYILEHNQPSRFWEPGSTPMSAVLRNAVWWTRLYPSDADQFLPLASGPLMRKPIRLKCSIGRWQHRPAYSVDFWLNWEWESPTNMSGPVIQLLGQPPAGLHPVQKDGPLTSETSQSRGRHVRPVFYHRTGQLAYVWFSHGAAVPAVLYDAAARTLDSIRYTWHRGNSAIHVWREGKVVGLIWPCGISAPEVIANARHELRRSFAKNIKIKGHSRPKKNKKKLPVTLTRRLARLVDVRKILRPGETASAALARRLRGKTKGQIKQMLYELESGEPS